MALLTIVYWRDIPAQIVVKAGRRSVARRELGLRFTEAIDMCAMRSGATDSGDYLDEWRRGDAVEVGSDLEAEAERAANDIEAQYTKNRLKQLIDNGGRALKN